MSKVWESVRGRRFPSAHDEKNTFNACGFGPHRHTHVGIQDARYSLWLSSGVHDTGFHSPILLRIRILDSNGTGQAGRHLD